LKTFSTFAPARAGGASKRPGILASFSPSGWYADWTGSAPMGYGLTMPNNALQLLVLPCVLVALLLL
jgi:hypothetical protein